MRFAGPISVRWPMYRLRQSARFLMLCMWSLSFTFAGLTFSRPVYPVADRAAGGDRISHFSESSMLCLYR